jgi:predicted dehydrogenase/threonine dehydrogenase-like Zn-dependent dehydrogenase
MKQVILKQGQAIVENIPAPIAESGTVLVQVSHSCISAGTEMSSLQTSGDPLWKRALKRPDHAKKVLQMVATNGFSRTKSLVQGMLAAGSATGYSAAGKIIAVGEGVSDLQVGDRVACAGAQCAHHAEIIRAPRNLVVKIPKDVDFADASTVTLGAIAMQGVRRVNPTLGETFVVIGLGILGQITTQLLKANGCQVIGIDLDNDRVQLAEDLGMNFSLQHNKDQLKEILQLTNGHGADGVIITAAASSNDIISTAFQMCRKKGRVVLVGDVGLNIKREDMYKKELDFHISCSYGPGRYDTYYEEQGLEYPISHVRWTENRNMQSYLQLIANNQIDVKPLVGQNFAIDKASEAYQVLKQKDNRPLIVLLSYQMDDHVVNETKILNSRATKTKKSGAINIAVLGAGGFAKGMHLPNLTKLTNRFNLKAIVSRTGHNAAATAKQFGADYSSTNYQEILNDPEIDAVIIATRHDLHAKMAIDALKAGKHVLLEKPLVIDESELQLIKDLYKENNDMPILLTGFNRRFSKHVKRIHELSKNRINPMVINYRVNAGYIPLEHWVHGESGAGRNIGEACHFYDVFTYLTGSKIISIEANAINPASEHYSYSDNFLVQLKFADGSIASLTYTALGSKKYPKESLDVFVDGMVFELNNYKSLNIYGSKVKGVHTKAIEKGQKEELIAFADAIQNGSDWPIPFWQQIQVMDICFAVDKKLRGN